MKITFEKEVIVKTEKQIQSNIVTWLKLNGFSVDVITKGMYGNNGISDIICTKKGLAIYIEVKRVGKKPTKLQCEFLKTKKEFGAIAIWATSVDEVQAKLKGI
jgi:Holliday junction resolvase